MMRFQISVPPAGRTRNLDPFSVGLLSAVAGVFLVRDCWKMGDEIEMDASKASFPPLPYHSYFILGTAYNQSHGIILSTPEITKQSVGDNHQSPLLRDLSSKCRH